MFTDMGQELCKLCERKLVEGFDDYVVNRLTTLGYKARLKTVQLEDKQLAKI